MKSLTILRHGKAARGENHPVDFDRPLTKRGRKDIDRVVEVLQRLDPPIDWIISSPAVRAKQSAESVAVQLHLKDHLVCEPTIYDGGPEGLLSLLEHVPSEKQHALLVGHNPTLEQLVSGLCAGSVSRMTNSLSTAGVANIELQIMWWEQVRWGAGLLRLFLRPRLIG
jgi:phosphohistidine phosphatase